MDVGNTNTDVVVADDRIITSSRARLRTNSDVIELGNDLPRAGGMEAPKPIPKEKTRSEDAQSRGQ